MLSGRAQYTERAGSVGCSFDGPGQAFAGAWAVPKASSSARPAGVVRTVMSARTTIVGWNGRV